MSEENNSIPEPVDGKFVFQISPNMRIRFNAEGWVEEIGRGTAEENETVLNGVPGTKLDDLYASRYYDLYSRVVLIDVHAAKGSQDNSRGYAAIMFKDLEHGCPIYNRVNTAIQIGNKYFGMSIKSL